MKRLLLLAVLAASPLFGQEVRLDTVLHGGRDALISVDALPPGAEEWEAFLSTDGGAHYAVRITPHLDASIHAFRFRVPNVSTRDARIILRTGDEVHERIVAIPRSFTIEADYAQLDVGNVRASDAPGESARFDDDRVAEWRDADGEKRTRNDIALHANRTLVEESHDDLETTSASMGLVCDQRVVARASQLIQRPQNSRVIARDPLLLSRRLNI
jgi:hypothetical protein